MSGQMQGQAHTLDVRVYYEDTDFSGVVYHANYLKFAERGRSDFLRLSGVHHSQLIEMDPPLAFVVSAMQIEFLVPAKIDDVLFVESTLTQARGARFEFYQRIMRGDTCLWKGRIEAACIDLEGRPRRIPKFACEALQAYVSDRPPEGFSGHER
jgi:acyl-CoA thioester hydrolase